MKKYLSLFASTALILIGFLFASPAHALTKCSFTRDLALGDTGEDVRCLQKYLNESNTFVATEGVGSPGQETSLYREKTVAAVKKWQTSKGIAPATGTWGPLSRGLYEKLLALGTAPIVTTPTSPTITTPVVTTPTQSANEKAARASLKAAVTELEKSERDFAKAEDKGERIKDAKDPLRDAQKAILKALTAFLTADFKEARDWADTARSNAEDVQEELGTDNESNKANKSDAEDAIEKVKEEIDDANDDIDDEEDDGEDVDDARDIMKDVRGLLRDAEDAYDDDDWDEVLDIVDEIDDLIDEALDSI